MEQKHGGRVKIQYSSPLHAKTKKTTLNLNLFQKNTKIKWLISRTVHDGQLTNYTILYGLCVIIYSTRGVF